MQHCNLSGYNKLMKAFQLSYVDFCLNPCYNIESKMRIKVILTMLLSRHLLYANLNYNEPRKEGGMHRYGQQYDGNHL